MIITINDYIVVLGDFEGNLPVRVLQNNVLESFLNANTRAIDDWEAMVLSGRIRREVSRDIAPRAVQSPSVDYDTGTIVIQEVFEAALWATSYGIMVLHDCWAERYARGEELTQLDDTDSRIRDAFGFLAYTESLFRSYQPWPLALPNPQKYLLEKKDLVEKANNLYVSAASFSLAHEFAHVYLGHGNASFRSLLLKARTSPMTLTEIEQSQLKQMENEADRFAVDHFVTELDSDSEKTVRLYGIVITYLCFLIGTKKSSQLRSSTHPDMGTRILNVLSQDISDQGFRDSLRGAVILALTYFLNRQGISLRGQAFNDAEDALEYCLISLPS
ncbi:MAG: ImmA/IrrE family metallo-endopeptidase [Candidatus Hydrogenedentes bacterium]|nr:ImmA/IrrE family metallo-endopeptidase [Candidatus Hydrogenedentota bacterium]